MQSNDAMHTIEDIGRGHSRSTVNVLPSISYPLNRDVRSYIGYRSYIVYQTWFETRSKIKF